MRSEKIDPALPVTIVGAGLVGSLLATFLARRGFSVEVLERRPDMRRAAISAGRSINLAVSVRGLHALKQLGLEEQVLAQAVPMRGRMIHAADGALTFQRYGKDDSECINSVSRGELNKLLMSVAEKTGKVKIAFDQRVTGADLVGGKLRVRDEKSGAERELSAPCVIGTDGSASVVREEILRLSGMPSSSETLDYGYKELVIPPGPGGSFRIEKNALHIWPRGTFMLIALPNQDGSFTCTLFLPHKGPLSFEELGHPEQVRALFSEQFPDALPLIDRLEKTFFENPTGHMVTVKCPSWHHEDRALLLGDAAHAIVPFFGQGMNCGFEDCTIFDELLDQSLAGNGTLEEVFATLAASRKPNADAIADLAVENFVEMRDKVGNPRFLLEKAVERILQDKFPGEYVSRYGLVTFSREPYRFAHEMGRVQNEILAELCGKLESPEGVDLERAATLIRSKLTPLFKLHQKGISHGS
jgi:kynurenine 3-monooxygenase